MNGVKDGNCEHLEAHSDSEWVAWRIENAGATASATAQRGQAQVSWYSAIAMACGDDHTIGVNDRIEVAGVGSLCSQIVRLKA